MIKRANSIAALLGATVAAAMLTGCEANPQSGVGLVLPEGDADAGLAAFVDLGCARCHVIADLELPATDRVLDPPVQLGGEVRHVRTYGQLVTAIINPQHIVTPRHAEALGLAPGEDGSPMPTLNSTMTVAQMIDLVSLLHGRYTQVGVDYVGYGSYRRTKSGSDE